MNVARTTQERQERVIRLLEVLFGLADAPIIAQRHSLSHPHAALLPDAPTAAPGERSACPARDA
jgi:hypothetical protein